MRESIVNAPKCPNCGAPFHMRVGVCSYCGSYIERYKGPNVEPLYSPLYGGSYLVGSTYCSTAGGVSVTNCYITK